MKKVLLPLLCVAILLTGCNDNKPRWDGTYEVDGEWEIWSATEQNDCFMLRVGAFNYDAVLESDAAEEDYLFTGSDDGERCWTRNYERVGNQLLLSEAYNVLVTPDCEVRIERERVISLDSDDAFAETSTVHVTYVSGDNCPPDALPCDAEFASIGLRCADCWMTCDGAAMIEDPELATPAAPGP